MAIVGYESDSDVDVIGQSDATRVINQQHKVNIKLSPEKIIQKNKEEDAPPLKKQAVALYEREKRLGELRDINMTDTLAFLPLPSTINNDNYILSSNNKTSMSSNQSINQTNDKVHGDSDTEDETVFIPNEKDDVDLSLCGIFSLSERLPNDQPTVSDTLHSAPLGCTSVSVSPFEDTEGPVFGPVAPPAMASSSSSHTHTHSGGGGVVGGVGGGVGGVSSSSWTERRRVELAEAALLEQESQCDRLCKKPPGKEWRSIESGGGGNSTAAVTAATLQDPDWYLKSQKEKEDADRRRAMIYGTSEGVEPVKSKSFKADGAQRRKHQITYLAQESIDREAELVEKMTRGRANKIDTYRKYGW
eukprot:GHVR01190994.1.p1 GENE.GHVR01190994.1~~GHVR01190994.1.p1  ORF type:complete len:360 (+),score=127.69 GHVR01190994.1:40-1119(+)